MKVIVTQGPPTTRIHFPVPLTDKIEPTRPLIEARPAHAIITQSEVRDICDFCVKEGFDEGAIVVRRTVQTLAMATSPHSWGVVVYLNKYAPHGPEWKPLRVRWLSSGEPSLLYNMSELMLVHPSYAAQDLEDFINAQDPIWKK